ncbi:MAG: hypothetical protein KKB65_06570 [Nanoarchaeota archaeon]|nr:hypothetical protein [Nanoarchaeota archaeon]MBU1030871.1 hypothetical protein [Nanoarchaeota archaeon]MBU1849754.1 hypothetical protein [Nanoarchaeota archaeon]
MLKSVFVIGMPASGKTTFVRHIQKMLPNKFVIHMDDYFFVNLMKKIENCFEEDIFFNKNTGSFVDGKLFLCLTDLIISEYKLLCDEVHIDSYQALNLMIDTLNKFNLGLIAKKIDLSILKKDESVKEALDSFIDSYDLNLNCLQKGAVLFAFEFSRGVRKDKIASQTDGLGYMNAFSIIPETLLLQSKIIYIKTDLDFRTENNLRRKGILSDKDFILNHHVSEKAMNINYFDDDFGDLDNKNLSVIENKNDVDWNVIGSSLVKELLL